MHRLSADQRLPDGDSLYGMSSSWKAINESYCWVPLGGAEEKSQLDAARPDFWTSYQLEAIAIWISGDGK